jgi:hypothetical protein
VRRDATARPDTSPPFSARLPGDIPSRAPRLEREVATRLDTGRDPSHHEPWHVRTRAPGCERRWRDSSGHESRHLGETSRRLRTRVAPRVPSTGSSSGDESRLSSGDVELRREKSPDPRRRCRGSSRDQSLPVESPTAMGVGSRCESCGVSLRGVRGLFAMRGRCRHRCLKWCSISSAVACLGHLGPLRGIRLLERGRAPRLGLRQPPLARGSDEGLFEALSRRRCRRRKVADALARC